MRTILVSIIPPSNKRGRRVWRRRSIAPRPPSRSTHRGREQQFRHRIEITSGRFPALSPCTLTNHVTSSWQQRKNLADPVVPLRQLTLVNRASPPNESTPRRSADRPAATGSVRHAHRARPIRRSVLQNDFRSPVTVVFSLKRLDPTEPESTIITFTAFSFISFIAFLFISQNHPRVHDNPQHQPSGHSPEVDSSRETSLISRPHRSIKLINTGSSHPHAAKQA